MKPLHLLLLATLLPILAACGETPQYGPGDDSRENLPGAAPLVRAVNPSLRDIDRVLEITGEVRALKSAVVSARVSGVVILKLLKEVGDEVKKDALLALLEDDELSQKEKETAVAAREAKVRVTEASFALKELEAQKKGQAKTLAQKKKTLDRLIAQEAGGAAAGMDLDEAQAAYDRELSEQERLGIQIKKAEVALELAGLAEEATKLTHAKAQREFHWARVLAPFAGIVALRSAEEGQLTGGGKDDLYQIFAPETLVIEAHVPQRDLNDMRPDLPVKLAAEALPGRTLEGRVSLVAPIVEEDTGTIMVRIQPSNPRDFKPGLFVSGRIVLETRKGTLAIPRKAVGYERERPFVYVIENTPDGSGRRVRRVWFKEGLADGEMVEMLAQDGGGPAPIGPEASIVLVGLDRLRDGDLVRVEAGEPVAGPTGQKAAAGNGG